MRQPGARVSNLGYYADRVAGHCAVVVPIVESSICVEVFIGHMYQIAIVLEDSSSMVIPNSYRWC